MRAFIAIELPDSVRVPLGELVSRLKKTGVRASWVCSDRMHLTLRFLGDVTEGHVAALSESMSEACHDASAFSLACEVLGAFPNLRKPGVVWAGIAPLEPDLARIQSAADHSAVACGLSPETKRFHPHITLARIKDPRNASALARAVELEGDFAAGAFAVPHVSLFSSELTPRGPVYTRIREFPLKRVEP